MVASPSTRTRCKLKMMDQISQLVCTRKGDCEGTLAVKAVIVFVLCICYATVPILISECKSAGDVPSPCPYQAAKKYSKCSHIRH